MIRGLISTLGLTTGVGVLLLVSSPLEAGAINNSSPLSDILTLTIGNNVYTVTANEAQENAQPGTIFSIDSSVISSNDLITAAPQPLVYIGEPGGGISDIVGVFPAQDNYEGYSLSNWWGGWCWYSSCQNNDYVLGFISDPLGKDYKGLTCADVGGCLAPNSDGTFTLTPGDFLTRSFLRANGGNVTLTFWSDNDNAVVPEPATTGIFWSLAALGLCVWKRRKTA